MKVAAIRCINVLIACLLGATFCEAQSIYKSSYMAENPSKWIKLHDLPKDKLPPLLSGYYFHIPDSNVIQFYAESKKGILSPIKTWRDQCVYNISKGETKTFYETSGITRLCSGSPYNETNVCCYFNLQDLDVPVFERVEITDEDGDYAYKGDSLLLANDIAGAVKAYEHISRPSAYMDITGKGIEILEAAYELATTVDKQGNPAKAADYIRTALSYEGLWMFNLDEFKSLSELEKYQANLWKYDRSMKELLETYLVDYGFYLLKANSLQEAISVNSYLCKLLTDSPDPCLNLGDALYNSGKTELAKQAYQNYIQIIQRIDAYQELPERVINRTR